jgi:hypothetical protein
MIGLPKDERSEGRMMGRNKVAEEGMYLILPIVLESEAKFIDSSARDLKMLLHEV